VTDTDRSVRSRSRWNFVTFMWTLEWADLFYFVLWM